MTLTFGIFEDIMAVLADKRRRGLTVSIFTYIALLPFNAYSFPLSFYGWSLRLKVTEVALLCVIGFALHVYARKELTIMKAPWLYIFLVLNAAAQFLSIIFAPGVVDNLAVAFAVARYNLLVFILVNVLRSEALLKAILAVMGVTALLVMLFVYQQYVFGSATYLLGINTLHYFAYALLMYGAGVAYCFLRGATERWARIVLIFFALFWLHLTVLHSVKISQLATLFFLVILCILVRGNRRKSAFLLIAFLCLFFLRFQIVPIANRYLSVKHGIAKNASIAYRTITSGFSPSISSSRPPSLSPSPSPSPSPSSSPSSLLPISPSTQTIPLVSTSLPFAERHFPDTLPIVPEPEYVNEYDEINKTRRRWSNEAVRDSISIRKRGIAVAWLIGRDYPWTGVGAGQTKYFFEEYSAKVRDEAQRPSRWPFKSFFFRDHEVLAAPADKGIFNIFMNALAETGWIGLGAFFGILGVVIASSIRALLIIRREHRIFPIHIFFPMMLSLLLVHQTIYLWVHPWFWTILALTYAASGAEMKRLKNENMKTGE